MKTETIINLGIVLGVVGFIGSVALLVMLSEDKPKPKKQQAPDTVRIENPCNVCGIVETYSLNVNCYHYGDTIAE